MRHALLTILACFALLAPALAQDEPQAATANPEISRTDLDYQLVPLTQAQLKIEADAWLGLVQEICDGIAKAQIEQAAEDTTAERKAALQEEISGPLTEQRTQRIDKMLDVVKAFEAKGGAAEEAEVYKQYAAAVGGIKLDVTDAGAFYTTVKNWVISPEGGIRIGLNIIKFLAVLFVFRILSKIVGKLVARALKSFGKSSDLLRDFFVGTTKKVTFFVGIVVALSMLEVDIGPFLAAMGAAGFVIGFALQGTLSNFAAGIMILLYRPYDVGDYVTVSGVSGTVVAMNLVSTSVKSPDNQVIVVPNGSIWGGIITNVTGQDIRRVDLTFGIGYGDDIAKAEEVMKKVVGSHELVLKDPETVIKVHELADSSVNFVCRPWVKTSDYWTVYWDLTRAVKEAFDAAQISIPFPQQDVHVHQIADS